MTPSEAMQKYLDEKRTDLHEKIRASGRQVRKLTEEEYRQLQAEITARNAAAAMQKQPPFDPKTTGLTHAELALDWPDVRMGISDAPKAVEAIRPAFNRGHGMIFLWGTYGQAKTLVGKILIARAYTVGKRAAYANVASVLDDIRLAFDEQEHKTTELIRRMSWWMERDVLFLDELDKANSTQWAQERLFQLLDGRYTKAIREEALTVIASNESHEDLDGYLRSRLQDRRVGPVIHLNGPDGRQVMPDEWRY